MLASLPSLLTAAVVATSLVHRPPPLACPDIPFGSAISRGWQVVVDAGHGGVDPGMSGPLLSSLGVRPASPGARFQEKDVTLAVATQLADRLRARGVLVTMTRTRDTLIALADRGRLANAAHAALFVSVHVNAAASPRESGSDTYFLAEAVTEDARRAEAMENAAVRFEGAPPTAPSDALAFLLSDMAQNEHLREAADLATVVQSSLTCRVPGRVRTPRQANFAVLRGSFMPAVLAEIGFGTNPSDAAYLLSEFGQAQTATRLAEGVIAYLARSERRGSRPDGARATSAPSRLAHSANSGTPGHIESGPATPDGRSTAVSAGPPTSGRHVARGSRRPAPPFVPGAPTISP
jgi:N-acetylmuramoyl-L-alanine amidase